MAETIFDLERKSIQIDFFELGNPIFVLYLYKFDFSEIISILHNRLN